MSRNFINIIKILCFLFLFCRVVSAKTVPESTRTNTSHISQVSNATWHDFSHLLDVKKGSHVSGVSNLKKYLHKFGYIDSSKNNITDEFDNNLESAISLYQKNHGLAITGKLDSKTVNLMSQPRCGVSDAKLPVHFSLFDGTPKWNRTTPFTLTYAFSKTHKLDYVTPAEIKPVFQRAFSRWATVIPVNFEEIDDETKADLKIGFYNGRHGDDSAFDGALGVLAHAAPPENGSVHFDSDETWIVDGDDFIDYIMGFIMSAVDLESVAVHEIGHLLGLEHSSEPSAVMYPTISPMTQKVELSHDDVAGVIELYGQNPNFQFNENGAVSDRFLFGNFAGYTLLLLLVLMIFLLS